MANKDILLSYLRENKQGYCDDCLSELLGIRPRQAINQAGRALANDGLIARDRGICHNCRKEKKVNSSKGKLEETTGDEQARQPPARPDVIRNDRVYGTEDKVRNEIMKTLFEHFGDRNSWHGEGEKAHFRFKEIYGNVVCDAERALVYLLPNEHSLSHKSDILVTDEVNKRYVSIEIKHRSSVTDQFKCRSYDMYHLKEQFKDNIIGIMIYVKADRGISIRQAEKISYWFDHFIGIPTEMRDVPTIWDGMIEVIHEYLQNAIGRNQ